MRKYNSFNVRVRGVRAYSGARLYEVRDDGWEEENDKVGYIDAIEFTVRPNEALAALARNGLFFPGPKRAKLIEQISAVESFADAPLFDRIGHNGDHFVYPSGEVFSPPGAPDGDVIIETRRDKGHKAGSQENWLAGVAAPLAGNEICEFFLSIPFAGPLRHYTQRVQNFGWELIGEPGTGKSVLLQLMSSICGGCLGGDEGNFGLSFAATAAGIEYETRHYADLAMIIDEGNLFEFSASKGGRAKALIQLLMALGKGQEKQRYGATTRTFRFVYVTSSNETLLEIIGGSSNDSVIEAVTDRLMTISLRDREQGVFNEVSPGYSDSGDFIADLINAASNNHGVAMRHFLQGLVTLAAKDREILAARIEEHISDFKRETGVDPNAGSARRVAESFGLVYAAGRLAIHLGALPDTYDPLTSTLACYRLYRAAVRPQMTAADTIRDLLDDNEVIDLDKGLPGLTDDELKDVKAFRQTNRGGEIELLIRPQSLRRLIPNWNLVRRDDFEVLRMITREKRGFTVKRTLRENVKKDRVICLVPDRQPSDARREPPVGDPPAPAKRTSKRSRGRRGRRPAPSK